MRRPLACSLLLLGLLAAPEEAAAQGFIIPEIGARKNGMGAAVGRPDDLTAIYHNPGALALLPGTRAGFCFTAAYLQTDIRLRQWPGSDELISTPVDADGYYPRQTPGVFAPIPFIGASTNVLTDRLTVALGLYVPNAAGATFGEDAPSRYHIIDAYVISAYLTAAVGWRPLDWLAVGMGHSLVHIRVQRRALLYPKVKIGGGQEQDLSGLIGKNAQLELTGSDWKYVFSLGVQVWPHETLSVGLMMMTRYNVALTGPLTITPGDGALPAFKEPEFTDNQHETTIVSPWIFAVGANWDITPWLEIGAELRYYTNSLVDEQVTAITNEGVLKDLLPEGFVTPKNLHDSFHVGAGFKVAPTLPLDLDLMTGFHYENSASPDNTVEVSAPSFDILAFHVGARWRFAERFALTLIYSHYRYLERTTSDSITSPPTNFIGSAHNNQATIAFEARIADGIGVSSAD